MPRKYLIIKVVLVLSAACINSAVAVDTVYAFAEQKAYNMTLTSVADTRNMVNGLFNIITNTSASLTGYPGQSFSVPVLDAQQSYLGSAPAPVENLSGNAVNPNTEQVLTQFNTTPNGVANALVNNLPTAASITQPTFSRADALTWNPSVSTAPPIPNGYLFVPAFTGGNVAIDSAAEGLIQSTNAVSGISQAGWQITGSFTLTSSDSVNLGFNLINRLVAYADVAGNVASTNTQFVFRITDQAFPFNPQYAPSPIAYSLSFPVVGSTTQNVNASYALTSATLAAGNYNFTITGTTQTQVSLVPEPASYVMMGLGLVTVGGLRFRRKMLKGLGK